MELVNFLIFIYDKLNIIQYDIEIIYLHYKNNQNYFLSNYLFLKNIYYLFKIFFSFYIYSCNLLYYNISYIEDFLLSLTCVYNILISFYFIDYITIIFISVIIFSYQNKYETI